MYFQIRKIILWPKDRTFGPRLVEFKLGALNIITGYSRTGKSAVIPIINYCLGSGRCSIPVNTIRNSCSWFGLLVQLEDDQVLIARGSPEKNKAASNDYYIEQGKEVVVPREVEKNLSRDDVKTFLDELAGLTRLRTDSSSDSGFKARPSFRDTAAFNFQPQNIVANPDVLFFKADSYEHREKLKSIFPYLLGVVTPATLAKELELARVNKLLRRKENELSSVREVSARWVAEIDSQLLKAQELGLVQEVRKDDDIDRKLASLDSIVKRTDYQYNLTSNTMAAVLHELSTLQHEETEVGTEVRVLRSRLSEMQRLLSATAQFSSGLFIQRERLRVSTWFHDQLVDGHESCPACGSDEPNQHHRGLVDSLVEALRDIEGDSAQLKNAPASLDRDFQNVKEELSVRLDHLRSVQTKIRSLEERSEAARKARSSLAEVARFLGSVERSLDIYTRLGTDSELADEIAELRLQKAELERIIDHKGLRQRLDAALRAISQSAGRIAATMDVEYRDAAIEFSLQDLNIKVNCDGTVSYLWELGSGSNWLAYHVAMALAFQAYFSRIPNGSVPSFVVFDQPSQVYFPKRVVGENEDPDWLDKDLLAVKQVFSSFSRFVRRNEGKVQVIVLDHAAEDVWGDLPDVHLVEEWRGGVKLVPNEWIPDPTETSTPRLPPGDL